MKVVQINATCGVGSTGKICVAVSKLLTNCGTENYIIYSSRDSDYHLGIKCATKWYNKFQSLESHIFGNYGFNSGLATRRIISEIEKIRPDIVHLHNLHGHNCDLEMLFTYFQKKPEIRLFWTFHDCWAFTGYCPHYMMAKCFQWKNQCTTCSQYHDYSFFFDKCSDNFNKKKKLLSGLNITIITPSM